MPKSRPDFITIRLSDHALAQLGGEAAVRVSNAHMHYQFTGSGPVEVLRRPEWLMLQHDTFDGQPLFQEAAASAPLSTIPDTDEA